MAAQRILAALAALGIAFGLGWWRCSVQQAGEQAKVDLGQSEQLREEEHHHAITTVKKLDRFARRLQVDQGAALVARDDLVGVQLAADRLLAEPAPAAAAACGPDPRIPGLVQLLREGAGLVEEGPRHLESFAPSETPSASAPSTPKSTPPESTNTP